MAGTHTHIVTLVVIHTYTNVMRKKRELLARVYIIHHKCQIMTNLRSWLDCHSSVDSMPRHG